MTPMLPFSMPLAHFVVFIPAIEQDPHGDGHWCSDLVGGSTGSTARPGGWARTSAEPRRLSLAWDSLGLLKQASDGEVGGQTYATHQFTYAPSGLRIRDRRTASSIGRKAVSGVTP
jgi:hypothetical protein